MPAIRNGVIAGDRKIAPPREHCYLNWVVAQTEANRGDVDHEELLPWPYPKGHIEA